MGCQLACLFERFKFNSVTKIKDQIPFTVNLKYLIGPITIYNQSTTYNHSCFCFFVFQIRDKRKLAEKSSDENRRKKKKKKEKSKEDNTNPLQSNAPIVIISSYD